MAFGPLLQASDEPPQSQKDDRQAHHPQSQLRCRHQKGHTNCLCVPVPKLDAARGSFSVPPQPAGPIAQGPLGHAQREAGRGYEIGFHIEAFRDGPVAHQGGKGTPR